MEEAQYCPPLTGTGTEGMTGWILGQNRHPWSAEHCGDSGQQFGPYATLSRFPYVRSATEADLTHASGHFSPHPAAQNLEGAKVPLKGPPPLCCAILLPWLLDPTAEIHTHAPTFMHVSKTADFNGTLMSSKLYSSEVMQMNKCLPDWSHRL